MCKSACMQLYKKKILVPYIIGLFDYTDYISIDVSILLKYVTADTLSEFAV